MSTRFIEGICSEALASRAVKHPYLTALCQGDFPNIDLAFKDFAYQYGAYCSQFTVYLSAVVENLSKDQHRTFLLENLAEEQGNCHNIELSPSILASTEGQTHSALFRRFQEALGVNLAYRHSTSLCAGAINWSEQFLQLCETSELTGIGAIGIGTELIVSSIYQQIVESLKAHSNLTPAQRVFFDLHSACDDEHAAQIIAITQDLAITENACKEIEKGVFTAIDLRVQFWDEMLKRAYKLQPNTNSNQQTSIERCQVV